MLSAIQLAFYYASTLQEFFDRVRERVERVVDVEREGEHLVALPSYTGLQLLGAAVPNADEWLSLDEIASARGYNSARAMLSAVTPPLSDFALVCRARGTPAYHDLDPLGGLTVEDVFRTSAPAAQRIFETTARELAARFGVYFIPGSLMLPSAQGQLLNTALLYDPDGNPIGGGWALARN